ncbi:PAS domain-containing protein [Pontixanthobacter aestiaquae]|uniref:PAS domain-containing protein n=1 Tax=Pontixanthobacter aestiaquae TaxID=1509367 RepID=A0A844Z3S5_9SPHN|nr:PAS domain-containing protein [Pontixanthobacter aestiaquae]MDN3646638.1 PAS domain-containing protein [Pontixanthobacter aestiaquae]MXO82378.1 PAS domain-containing protein [Pontixanthobacter aestiaquae]
MNEQSNSVALIEFGAIISVIFALASLAYAIFVTLSNRYLKADLRRAEDGLRLAGEVGGIGTWTLDLELEELDWSDQVFALHDRDKGLGSPTLEEALAYYHPQDRNRVGALVDEAIQSGKGFDFLAKLTSEDGAVKTVISRGVCQRDKDGNIGWVFGVIIEASRANAIDTAISDIYGSAGSDDTLHRNAD